MDNFQYDDLEIKAQEKNGIMVLLWSGSCDARCPAFALNPYLNEILEKSKEYEVCLFDFIDLDFMNSSTIAALLKMVEKIKNHPTHFQLVFSEQKDWQDFNYRMMKLVTRNVPNITN